MNTEIYCGLHYVSLTCTYAIMTNKVVRLKVTCALPFMYQVYVSGWTDHNDTIGNSKLRIYGFLSVLLWSTFLFVTFRQCFNVAVVIWTTCEIWLDKLILPRLLNNTEQQFVYFSDCRTSKRVILKPALSMPNMLC